MKFQLKFTPQANEQFLALDESLRLRVVEKLRHFLESDSKPEPLEGNLKGFYKLRVGDYRIVFELIDSTQMRVRAIGHRSKVYSELARE